MSKIPVSPALQHLADGRAFAVRVTPKASRNAVTFDAAGAADLRISVTVVPEDGKANREVVKLLAGVLGVAKSRVVLLRGATSRDKLFRVID